MRGRHRGGGRGGGGRFDILDTFLLESLGPKYSGVEEISKGLDQIDEGTNRVRGSEWNYPRHLVKWLRSHTSF